ncbi:zwei Ig domain protein zig-8 isoform X2 [Aplysia californica]|uniref:Zwei Ig domain protein zig-8 isoform X2 n=1 Tax=Aplysia californica TaxID=6500 RepID=A0ABM1VXF4_APLCA|nr:zwei Ig domain protein zig-8 isoform X2 [Aplysia californica]
MTWTSDPNISMDPSRKPGQITNWDLVIRHLKPKDAGVYECQITSKAGLVRFVTLNVVGPPITKPVISITGKRYVNLGERIHLVCNASGGVRIPDEIDWFKAGDKIDSVKYRNIVIEKYQSMAHRSFISELIIDHSSLHDTGDYICRSSRNDIANLKVTVLHAGRDNYRRGTAEAGSQGGGTDPAGLSSYKCRILLLEICLAAMLTLNFSFFGLYS